MTSVVSVVALSAGNMKSMVRLAASFWMRLRDAVLLPYQLAVLFLSRKSAATLEMNASGRLAMMRSMRGGWQNSSSIIIDLSAERDASIHKARPSGSLLSGMYPGKCGF